MSFPDAPAILLSLPPSFRAPEVFLLFYFSFVGFGCPSPEGSSRNLATTTQYRLSSLAFPENEAPLAPGTSVPRSPATVSRASLSHYLFTVSFRTVSQVLEQQQLLPNGHRRLAEFVVLSGSVRESNLKSVTSPPSAASIPLAPVVLASAVSALFRWLRRCAGKHASAETLAYRTWNRVSRPVG